MYYLIKTSSMWGMGGRLESCKMIKISASKNKLNNYLKDLFAEAMDDPEVEFINQEYTDEYLDVEDIKDTLEVQYKCDGMDYTAIRYDIVSDKDAEMI